MRIISGKFRGRRVSPPVKNWPTRPTTDFAREALFNILRNRLDFENVSALDLFGGTGLNAIECISLGSPSVTYVDKHRACVNYVKQLAMELDITDVLDIISMDVFHFLESIEDTFHFIFADPPYDHPKLHELPDIIFSRHILKDDGIFVLEHDHRHRFDDHACFREERKYGQSRLSFFVSG